MNGPHIAQVPDERVAAITLDLENNWNFQTDVLKYLVFDHLDRFIEMVQSLDLPLSVFVVGEILEERPNVIRTLDAELDVEFHLHSYHHDIEGKTDIEFEIEHGIRAFESTFGRKPNGYRAPQFIVDAADLAKLSQAGFEFDSSVCPSYRPGVYNHLDKPTVPYYPPGAPGLLELPISVHPILRIPFEQSFLRLLRGPYLSLLRRSNLPDPLIFNSHLHDFFHTAAHDELKGIRRYLFSNNIENSQDIFEEFVGILREEDYEFRKLSSIAATIRSQNRGSQ